MNYNKESKARSTGSNIQDHDSGIKSVLPYMRKCTVIFGHEILDALYASVNKILLNIFISVLVIFF